MKIIFAGTPDIAATVLQGLLDANYPITAVYTQPDRPAGRGQKLTQSPVKTLALTREIAVYQPTSLRTEEAKATLRELQPDVIIVVAYGLILPKDVLAIPPLGCINVHVSLLPRWRGAAPIQHAILQGDKKTGVSIMQMDEGLDTGPLLKQVACDIMLTDTSATLHDKLAQLGTTALLDILPQLNDITPTAQEEAGTTYADKIKKEAANICWEDIADTIDRQVRAYHPWPVAYSELATQRVRIWQGHVTQAQSNATPGTIINTGPQGIDVACGQGVFRIEQLQLPSKKRMHAADVLNGKKTPFVVGERFE